MGAWLSRSAAGLLGLWLLSPLLLAAPVTLNPQHPDRYTVVKGDTLWGVAGRFLNEPWRWPEVWKANPQIKNPDLIYPGDVLVLSANNGRPEISVERGGSQRGATVKLSPQVRAEPIDKAIPTIPLDTIQQFLTQTRVVDRQELENAPYIVASEGEHLINATGGKVYARGWPAEGTAPDTNTKFSIMRQGNAYLKAPDERDPDNKEQDILGYEASYIGEARLDKAGDPATLTITRAKREVLAGDRLLAIGEQAIEHNFMPHAPAQPVEARIISVVDGVTRIGQNQVVVLGLGKQGGLEVGHVLAVYRKGDKAPDPTAELRSQTVQLPDERAATLLVFRVHEQISYALVMQAAGALRLYDVVRNP
ncbi:MAG TPA: LysM domain-containing protein [Gammaproteobacteria bacterium]|nr:LysM domain-containing protein [Gammaproteobacteria bacterium]